MLTANSAPPSGQRKIAPTPAAQPAINISRRCRGVTRKTRASDDPMAAPNAATGPSGPAEPPEAITTTDEAA